MSLSLNSAAVIIVTFLIAGAASVSNENDGNNGTKIRESSSIQTKYLQNETERELQKIASSAPLISMNLQQDVQLNDMNTSAAITSYYTTNEATTTNPLKPNTIIRNNSALSLFKGEVSESFLKKINPHWLYFPPQTPTTHYIFTVIFVIMSIFGLTGNFLVIFVYVKCSSVRTPANNLIVNLAVADFIIMLEAPLFIYNCLYFGPATGDFGCKLYAMLGAVGGTVAIMTLCAISIDRYNVIVFPLNPSRSTTNMRSRIMILIVWGYSMPFALVPFIEISGISYSPEGFLTACSFDYLDNSPSNYWFIMSYAFAAYFLPLAAIAYCYFHILRVVLSAQKIQSSKEKNKTELRLAAIVMGIIGLWIFAWTPYCVVALLGILGYGSSITPLASMIPSLMAKIACCVDPYLYAVTHPRFRTELEKIFCSSRSESFAASFSRGQSRRNCNESECETMNLEPTEDERKRARRPLQRADSSVCEESIVSDNVVDSKH